MVAGLPAEGTGHPNQRLIPIQVASVCWVSLWVQTAALGSRIWQRSAVNHINGADPWTGPPAVASPACPPPVNCAWQGSTCMVPASTLCGLSGELDWIGVRLSALHGRHRKEDGHATTPTLPAQDLDRMVGFDSFLGGGRLADHRQARVAECDTCHQRPSTAGARTDVGGVIKEEALKAHPRHTEALE